MSLTGVGLTNSLTYCPTYYQCFLLSLRDREKRGGAIPPPLHVTLTNQMIFLGVKLRNAVVSGPDNFSLRLIESQQ
jgi:hypothetical protein